MKIVPFQIPRTTGEALRVQVDEVPYFYDNLHQHHEIQITLVERSTGVLVAGDHLGNFEPGEVYVFGSDLPHVFRNDRRYYEAQPPESARSTSVYFDERYLGEALWNAQEWETVRQLVSRAAGGLRVDGPTRRVAARLLQQLVEQQGLARLLTFLELLHELVRSSSLRLLSVSGLPELRDDRGENRRMNDILAFTFRESHRPIRLDEVARVANLTPEAFCRYFKLRTRKTYLTFLSEIRISQACQLLITTDLPVADVSTRVGFTNLSNFNRVFARTTGRTPTQYARRGHVARPDTRQQA